ncbi:MAG: hypothetical protein V1746_03800 [bacterium]
MDNLLQDGLLLFDFKASDHIEDEITVERMNAMKKAINANRVVKVVNGYFKRTSEGIVLVCNAGSGGTPVTITHPWQVLPYSDPDHPDLQIVKTRGGTCQGYNVYLNGAPMDVWDEVQYEIPGSGEREGFITLKVEWNAYGEILSMNVVWKSGDTQVGSYNQDAQIGSSGSSHLALAYIKVTSDGDDYKTEITQMAFHNVYCTVAPNNRGWFFGV